MAHNARQDTDLHQQRGISDAHLHQTFADILSDDRSAHVKMTIAAIAAAALLAPTIALAQATSSSSMTSSNSVSKAHVATAFEGSVVATRKDGKICRKKTETGTRLGGHVDCRTKAEWDEMAHNARQDTDLHQQRGIRKE